MELCEVEIIQMLKLEIKDRCNFEPPGPVSDHLQSNGRNCFCGGRSVNLEFLRLPCLLTSKVEKKRSYYLLKIVLFSHFPHKHGYGYVQIHFFFTYFLTMSLDEL